MLPENEEKEKLIRSQKIIPGLTLWEIDDVSKVYRKAEFEKQKTGDLNTRKKVLLKDNCFYIQKLNEKSLLKFIKKYFGNGFNKASE